jgi:hypothetical protein
MSKQFRESVRVLDAGELTVFYPLARDGKLVVAKDRVRRSLAIAKLDGTTAAHRLQADPNLVVLTLLDPGTIKAWVSPEEWERYGTLSVPEGE